MGGIGTDETQIFFCYNNRFPDSIIETDVNRSHVMNEKWKLYLKKINSK